MQRITRKQRVYAPLIGSAIAIFSLSSLARGENPSRGVPVIWDGDAGDMMWFNPQNWDPDALPGMSDTVLIQIGGPVVALNQPIVVDSLTAQTGLTLSSSSLTISNPSTVTGLFVDGLSPTIDSSTSTLDINGTSIFTSATKWDGLGTALNGEITALGSMLVMPDAQFALAGNLALVDSTFSQGLNANVTICGKLELQNSSLFSASNTDAIWVVTNGGSIGNIAATTSKISDTLQMAGGDLFSDIGSLEIRDFFNIDGGKATVSNNGTIRFIGPTGDGDNDFNELNVDELSGDGLIEIRSISTILKPPSGELRASVEGELGLLIQTSILLEGGLHNSAKMTLIGGQIIGLSLDQSAERLTAADGIIECLAGTRLAVETVVESQGTIKLTDDTSVDRTLRVNQGGLLELNKSINRVLPMHPLAKVEIGGLLSMPTGGSNSDINIPFNILSGGTVQIEDRRLQLKAGGRLQNGTISFVDTAASGFPSLGFNGDMSHTWIFENGLVLTDNGNRADLFIGNGFGAQPDVNINGDLTVNFTGVQSNAKVRVPQISGNGKLINTGSLTFERSVNMFAEVENRANLTIQSPSYSQLSLLTNTKSGTITQSGIVDVAQDTMLVNNGVWLMPTTTQIKPTDPLIPLLSQYFNDGILHATSGTSIISIKLINDAGVVIADGATLFIDHPVTVDEQGRNTLSGSWETRNNGFIVFPQDTPIVVTGPDSEIIGDGTHQPWITDVGSLEDGCSATLGDTNFSGDVGCSQSNFEVTEGSTCSTSGGYSFTDGSECTVNSDATLEATGAIDSGNDDPDLPSVLDNIQGVVLIGLGPITSPTLRAITVNIFANLTPILDDIGTMIVDGDLVIHPTGKLNINLDGVAASRVDVSGDLTVDGSVMISTLNGYTPVLGDSFSIASVTGAIIALPNRAIGDAGAGLAYGLVISGSDVLARVVCSADLTNDGVLNFFDVSSFLSTLPDYNNDDTFNFFDVSAFLVDFGEGCS
jgi:hypothetical protein